MQTNHIPQEILFARSIRRHIRRLAHVVSEENLVTELLIKKLSPLSQEELNNLKVIDPDVSRFIDSFIESRQGKTETSEIEAKK